MPCKFTIILSKHQELRPENENKTFPGVEQNLPRLGDKTRIDVR